MSCHSTGRLVIATANQNHRHYHHHHQFNFFLIGSRCQMVLMSLLSHDFRVVLSVTASALDWLAPPPQLSSSFCLRPESTCEIILSFSVFEYFLCDVTSTDLTPPLCGIT